MKVRKLTEAAQIEDAISDPETAHLVIDKDEVLGMNAVTGLVVEPEPIEDGVSITITAGEGAVIKKPVHLCFGVTHKEAIQHIVMDVEVQSNARIGILAHCIFPQAVDVKHLMDAAIKVGAGAKYTYLEKHIHSPQGGIEVIPKAHIELKEDARFETHFELIKGRVGTLDIDYETTCSKGSTMEMTAKVNGTGNDVIKISETGKLEGEGSRGVLTTRVAVRDEAQADVYNKLVATAPYARGHVDCKEIIQDRGKANAVPVVEVRHPKAHVTHEAAIGSVDTKQLETLMSRGLSEGEAVDLIIEGLLS